VRTETTPTIEELEKAVEERAHEVEELEGQLRDATSQIARAQQRFAELDERLTSLAAHAFRGDSKARLEVEALEAEHDELERNTRVTRAAAPELEKMLATAKQQLTEARREVHKARAADLRQQAQALDSERDRLAGELIDILDRQKSLDGKYVQTLNLFDQATANSRASDLEGPQRRWVKKTFAKFL
jgi:DNA repair exonuclease SbcCD ATPase subunit